MESYLLLSCNNVCGIFVEMVQGIAHDRGFADVVGSYQQGGSEHVDPETRVSIMAYRLSRIAHLVLLIISS